MRTNGPIEGLQSFDFIESSLLEALFDRFSDTVFFVKNEAGVYVVVNQSLVERHGLRSKSELLGKRPSDFTPGTMGEAWDEQDREVLNTGKPILNRLELHWYAPNSAGWCLTTKLPIKHSGRVVGIVGVSQDVRVPVARSEIPTGVAKAIAYSTENVEESITPASLAEIAGIEPRRLAATLKRIFGLTPSQWILKTRIEAACRLLRETELTIADIAFRCGYQDQSAFTRAFRATMRVAPKQYREQAKP